MAVLRITPIEVESVLKDRDYFISDGQHAPPHETPWIHTPPVPVAHDGVHDVPPVDIIHDGVHDVPPIDIIPRGVHDVPPIDIVHDGVHDVPLIDIVHDGVHDLPILHIPVDQVVEFRYAKYIRFLPLIMLLVPESEVLDLGRVL